VQFGHYVANAAQGDLGFSTHSGAGVSELVRKRLPVTLELALLAVLIGAVVGLPLGILAALKRGSPLDYVSNAFGLLGLSIPSFWLGLLLILGVAVKLGALPASGYVPFTSDPVGNLERMVMPAFVLGIGLAAVLMRQMRSAMLESLGTDYVRTARAKGLGEWSVVGKHALRNSLITVTTVIGLQLGALISGAVITEQIFSIAGFGRLTVESVQQRDYALIQGIVLVAAAGYVIVNLGVDLTYSLLNPRIRVSGRRA
jgi:peptide/nickel transport system permease protein